MEQMAYPTPEQIDAAIRSNIRQALATRPETLSRAQLAHALRVEPATTLQYASAYLTAPQIAHAQHSIKRGRTTRPLSEPWS